MRRGRECFRRARSARVARRLEFAHRLAKLRAEVWTSCRFEYLNSGLGGRAPQTFIKRRDRYGLAQR
jgi:hypothetical protein